MKELTYAPTATKIQLGNIEVMVGVITFHEKREL